jgi:hypothetical protein
VQNSFSGKKRARRVPAGFVERPDWEIRREQRPSDSDLLIPSIQAHEEKLGCTTHLAEPDAGFYSAKNEKGS